jgi:hypothetical protein
MPEEMYTYLYKKKNKTGAMNFMKWDIVTGKQQIPFTFWAANRKSQARRIAIGMV